MRKSPGVLQVFVSVPSTEVAERIAAGVIAEELAACVQTLGPMTSRYRWQGQVEQAVEWLLVIKTARPCLAALERFIQELHPYETPEILCLPVESANGAYLDWLQAQLRRPSRKR